MYIEKWWGNLIGDTDDSLCLVDYFEDKEEDLDLHDILIDLKLDKLLKRGSLKKDQDITYKIDSGLVISFSYAIDIVIDLSAVVLECLHNDGVNTNELDEYRDGIEFNILAKKEDLNLLIKELDCFIKKPSEYQLSIMMDEKTLVELVNACIEILEELKRYIK